MLHVVRCALGPLAGRRRKREYVLCGRIALTAARNYLERGRRLRLARRSAVSKKRHDCIGSGACARLVRLLVSAAPPKRGLWRITQDVHAGTGDDIGISASAGYHLNRSRSLHDHISNHLCLHLLRGSIQMTNAYSPLL